MARLRKFAIGVAAAAGAVWYARAVTRRNAALVRPRTRDANGNALPVSVHTYDDGETVEYTDVGEGDVLVWIPGADGPKETFSYQLPRFSKNYRVICADLRSRFDESDDFDRFVEDLLELCEAVDVERFVLIGQSLGSAITLRFASLFPERLRGIVLCNPLARLSYEHVGLNRTLLIPVAMATTRWLPTELSRALARVWCRLGLWLFDDSPGSEALIDYALYTGPRTVSPRISDARVDRLKGSDLGSELSGIHVPALVLKGPQDLYCPVSWALEIVDRLPDATYVPIPGTGHCSHISRPGAFNTALEDWLSALGPDARSDSMGGDA